MIPKENILYMWIIELTSGGYQDVDFFIDMVNTIENEKFTIKGEKTFLFPVQEEGKVIDMCGDFIYDVYGEEDVKAKNDINTWINACFNVIINRINDLYNLDENDVEYEIFINYMDSHLNLLDAFDDLDIKESYKNEIRDIIEPFN